VTVKNFKESVHVSNLNQKRKHIRSASKANTKQAKLTTIKAQTAENKARLDEANHSSGSSRRQR
jgi:hypothetical protein